MIVIRRKRIGDIGIIYLEGQLHCIKNLTNDIWCEVNNLANELEQSNSDKEIESNRYKLFNYISQSYNHPDENGNYCKEYSDTIDIKTRNEEEATKLELVGQTESNKLKALCKFNKDFKIIDDNKLQYQNFSEYIPDIVIDALYKAYDKRGKFSPASLINFLNFLFMSPSKAIRVDAFKWILNSKFSITESGLIISYRNVDTKFESTAADRKTILQSYCRVKLWKKPVKNFKLVKKTDGSIVRRDIRLFDLRPGEKYLYDDTLDVLYDRVLESNDTIYTDNYTHSMDIRLGEVVSMDRNMCDTNPYIACSRGLHQKSKGYNLDLGETVLVCLVNPYHLVAVPNSNTTKFRCCAYLPITLANFDENGLVEFDEGSYDFSEINKKILLNDLDYNTAELNSELDEKYFNKIINSNIDFIKNKTKNIN